MSLPWFLRFEERPESTSTAQSVWVYGQWHYLPINFSGNPIFRFCTSIEAAHAVVFEFEKELYEIEARLTEGLNQNAIGDEKEFSRLIRKEMSHWIIRFAIDCPDDWPESFRLYSAPQSSFEQVYLVRNRDGLFAGESFPNAREALLWVRRNFPETFTVGGVSPR